MHRDNKLSFQHYYQASKVDKIIKELKHSRIVIVGNSLLVSHLVRHFSSLGIKKIMIKISRNGTIDIIGNLTQKNVDLLILSSIGNESRIHEKINKLCIRNNIPFLTSRLFADHGEIGPFVIPHKTACYMCYRKRIESNLPDSQKVKNEVKRKISLLYPIIEIFSGYVSLEGLNFLTSYEVPVTIGNVIITDFKKFKTKIHPLLKIPYCPICGEE
jgi:hypothetical protein